MRTLNTIQDVLLKSVTYFPKFDSPKALVVCLYKVAKNRCLLTRRKSKFAPPQELSLQELMPDRRELEQLSADGRINPEAYAIRSQKASRLRGQSEIARALPCRSRPAGYDSAGSQREDMENSKASLILPDDTKH